MKITKQILPSAGLEAVCPLFSLGYVQSCSLLAAESKWDLEGELSPIATACGGGEQRTVEHAEHQQQMGFCTKHGTTVRMGEHAGGIDVFLDGLN